MENAIATAPQQQWLNASENDGRHAAWIAGRIQTLLSHYFQPDAPMEVQEAALGDWVEVMAHFSRQAIESACGSYLRDQPRRRPTPGDILRRCNAYADDKRKTADSELTAVEMKVAEFASYKGWMGYALAERAIKAGRDTNPLPWIISEQDHALYAVRHSEFNSKMKDGQPKTEKEQFA